MPGQEPGGGPGGPARHPHPVRRRGRRFLAVVLGVLAAPVLVLSGVGLATVGATVAGLDSPAGAQHQAAGPEARPDRSGPPPASPAPAPARPVLGVEAVDDKTPGARIVGVHIPGPGYSAGLVRGDVLLVFGTTRIDSAADLARAVARARPGQEVPLTVRHRSGGYQQLTATPGVVT
jgi:hypothetical protein